MDNIKKFYEDVSKVSDKSQKGFMGFMFHKLEKYCTSRDDKVLELISKNNNIFDILDVGCGRGKLLEKIVNLNVDIKKINGIDISENHLKEATKTFNNIGIKNNFYSINISSGINLPNDSYDLITCIAVLEHLFDPDFIIKEFNKLLKKGGKLIIQVPNIVVIQRRISFLFGNRPRTSWDPGRDGGHIVYFTKKDLKDLLIKNGFIIKKITGSGIFANLRNWWVSLLSPDIIIEAEKI